MWLLNFKVTRAPVKKNDYTFKTAPITARDLMVRLGDITGNIPGSMMTSCSRSMWIAVGLHNRWRRVNDGSLMSIIGVGF